MSIELTNAIQSLKPNAEFSLENNDYSTIVWDVLEGKAPTQTEVDAEIIRLQSVKEAEKVSKLAARTALLERLGITEDEAKLLLG